MMAIGHRSRMLEEALFKIDQAAVLVRNAARQRPLSRRERTELIGRVCDFLEEVDPGQPAG